VAAMEKAKTDKEAQGEFESEHPGYCGAQDTFYVGNLKGMGRIYQQTLVDTYTKLAFAKLYDRKTPVNMASLKACLADSQALYGPLKTSAKALTLSVQPPQT
jgi:hypothetical protein